MKPRQVIYLISIVCLFPSCEFKCTAGKKVEDNEVPGKKSRVLNEIKLETHQVRVEKAYLIFEDGDPVPQDNIIDFTEPVKMIVVVDSGWTAINGKVKLGASERMEVEGGEVLYEKDDLFGDEIGDGVSVEDAKFISLTAKIILKEKVRPLTTFLVSFRIWDKNSDAFIKGSYKLFAK